jgi:CTP:molybdopterin cytidylyltransferase MocA
VQQHQASVVRIEVDDAGILRDIDTPADLLD